MSARRWNACLWSLTGLVVTVLLLKFFVADVYRVDSGSMRPTLYGGRDRADGEEDSEHVLVVYGHDLRPARFDLAVFRSLDGTKPLVKRVAGLPGDRDLMIRGGDLFIDRKRLPPEAPRPAPVLVYDDRYLDPEQFFEHRRDGSVRREGDAWIVQGGGIQSPGSLLRYHPALRDDYLDRKNRRVPGVVEVNDAVLELEFLLEEPPASQKLHFHLVEEGDTFAVEIAATEEGGASVRLVRRNQSTLHPKRDPASDAPFSNQLLLGEARVALQAGRWYGLRFANIDNELRVGSPALGLDLRSSYAENEPWLGALPAGQHSLGSRVHFGAEDGTARFRSVRILRDLYYTDDGVFGAAPRPGRPSDEREAAPISLGPNDYFLLGDNSSASTDSRHFGAIKASQLIGTPVAVLWPRPHWIDAVTEP